MKGEKPEKGESMKHERGESKKVEKSEKATRKPGSCK